MINFFFNIFFYWLNFIHKIFFFILRFIFNIKFNLFFSIKLKILIIKEIKKIYNFFL